MKSKMASFATRFFGPKVVINFMKNQNAEKLGAELYDIVDELFDAEFGDKASDQINEKLVPFINRVMIGFSKRMDEKNTVVFNKKG